MPAVMDRTPYNMWMGKGSPTTEELVAAKVNKILDTHRPAPLPEGGVEKFEEILREAEEREHIVERH